MITSDSFEIAAAAFYKATGMLMPGKSIGSGVGWTEDQEIERKKLFEVWCAAVAYMQTTEKRENERLHAKVDKAVQVMEARIETCCGESILCVACSLFNSVLQSIKSPTKTLEEYGKRERAEEIQEAAEHACEKCHLGLMVRLAALRRKS